MELSLEQQLQVRLFQDRVQGMSEEVAKKMLVEMFIQWLDQENRMAAEMKKLAQGLGEEIEAICDAADEARGWGEE